MFFRTVVIIDLDLHHMPICSMRLVEGWFCGDRLCAGIPVTRDEVCVSP